MKVRNIFTCGGKNSKSTEIVDSSNEKYSDDIMKRRKAHFIQFVSILGGTLFEI